MAHQTPLHSKNLLEGGSVSCHLCRSTKFVLSFTSLSDKSAWNSLQFQGNAQELTQAGRIHVI